MPGKSVMAGLALAGVAAAAVGVDRLAERLIRRSEQLDVEQAALPGARFWLRGVPVHYVEQGRGFPVVLVHGFGASTFSYRFLIPALAERFRVLAVDLPGFGYSGRDPAAEYSQTAWAEQLAEFVERLGVRRAAFAGHSLGGGIVQRLAVSHPELVERLVLVSSVSAAEPLRTVPVVVAPLVRPLQALLAVRPGLARRMNRNIAYDPAYFGDEVWEEYMRPLRLPGSAAALRKMFRDMRLDRPLDLGQLHVPTLLLWGEHDQVVKPKVGRGLHKAIAGSRLEVVPEAGHLPLEERPEACNRLILDFLADLADQAGGPERLEVAAGIDAGGPS